MKMLTFNWTTISVFVLVVLSSVACQSCVSPTTSCDCFQDNGRTIINCRYKNLTAIPTFIDTRQVYDEIRFTSFEPTGTCQPSSGCNTITRLNANAFANLKVRTIDLRNNPVTHVDVSAFKASILTLESLLLEGNGANAIPYQAIAPLDIHLKSLHLENYGSSTLQSPIVLPFPNLESLTLKNWRNLDSINGDLFNIIQNLKTLRLISMPSMVTIPVSAIQKFLKLTTIEIMDSGIRAVLGDTFSPLSMLDEIKICNNIHLSSIDRRAFNGVTDSAVYLDVSNNNLDSIEFLRNGQWTALSYLKIDYNYNLRALPTGIFGNTPALRYLSCQSNGLNQIDQSMFLGLASLHTLDLAYNEITDISTGAFQNSPSLIELRLNDQQIHNQYMNFQNNSFFGVESSLEVLDLMNNKFDVPHFWKDLVRLNNLKVLDLTNTGIEYIPDKAFRGNIVLNTLILSGNNISSLNQNTFYGPRHSLRTIDLQRNSIRSIDECVLGDFQTKPALILFANLLICDCKLVWLYDWFKTQSHQALISSNIGMCASPSSLSNKFFEEFSRTDLCPAGSQLATCQDLYVTQTTSSTTTTTTATTTTKSPLPLFELLIVNVFESGIEVIWMISVKTFVTELRLDITSVSKVDSTATIFFGPDQSSYTFYQLHPDTFYTVCLVLKINDEFRNADANCKNIKTLPDNAVNTLKSILVPTRPDPGSVIG